MCNFSPYYRLSSAKLREKNDQKNFAASYIFIRDLFKALRRHDAGVAPQGVVAVMHCAAVALGHVLPTADAYDTGAPELIPQALPVAVATEERSCLQVVFIRVQAGDECGLRESFHPEIAKLQGDGEVAVRLEDEAGVPALEDLRRVAVGLFKLTGTQLKRVLRTGGERHVGVLLRDGIQDGQEDAAEISGLFPALRVQKNALTGGAEQLVGHADVVRQTLQLVGRCARRRDVGEAELVSPLDDSCVGRGDFTDSGHSLVAAPDNHCASEVHERMDGGGFRGGQLENIDTFRQRRGESAELLQEHDGQPAVYGGEL